MVKNILFYHGNCSSEKAKLALVSASVESSLLGCDVEAYEKVVQLLNKKYDCNMADCYRHPEYLNEIFHNLSENSRYYVVKSIQKGLGEFSYIKGISKFLDKLNE